MNVRRKRGWCGGRNLLGPGCRTVVAVAAGMLVTVVWTAGAYAQFIPPGTDCFETTAGSTRVQFGGISEIPPIPADFFFPGSEPFEGVVELRGDPLPDYPGAVNTLVRRMDEAMMPGPATVEIQLIALELVSTEPIVVLSAGGDEYPYDVSITLTPDMPSMGFMTITETIPSWGGEYDFSAASGGGIEVYARFNFFEAWPSGQDPIVWDAPPLILQSLGPQPWQYEVPELHCDPFNGFYPVPDVPMLTVLDGGASGEHGVIPPRWPDGCCLPDGECIDIDPEDCVMLGGVVQGMLCAGWLEACCLPEGHCLDLDPVCCDDMGGVAQGLGSGCVDMTIACCIDDGSICLDTDPICCDDEGGWIGFEPHCLGDLNGNGIDDACEQEIVTGCCLIDGVCVNTTPTECEAMGGIVQEDECAGWLEACCLPEGLCIDVDPLCCDDMNGVAQGLGTGCVDMTIACCIDDGSICLDTDPICCDDEGGWIGYEDHCLGDLNGNGIDDACELHPEYEACCYYSGDCWDMPPDQCYHSGGVPMGPGTNCSDIICPVHEPKWTQFVADGEQGFDAHSDLWLYDPSTVPLIKWEQLPDPEWPGLHAHDWSTGPGERAWTILADDWICEGGEVVGVSWWGNYELDALNQEIRGSGIDYFHLSLHICGGGDPWCLPLDPELFGFDVPFNASLEQPTGMVNVEGSPIYLYEFELPPFAQEPGMHYWLDITAVSNYPEDPPMWRWQEANRSFEFLGWAPAAEKWEPPIPGVWQSIVWPTIPESYSDMAFKITSQEPGQEVNKVVADDFISDGRAIQAVRWWGSYFDERYAPDQPSAEPYVLDGWLISFHHAYEGQITPPDIWYNPPPTVLGVYFVPPEVVSILPLDMMDCNGHAVYEYVVKLDRCCPICAEVDPRTGLMPAQPDAFHETAQLRYWIDIQAVTGAKWVPSAVDPFCDLEFTGHLPSDMTLNGHFWGWHTSPANSEPQGPLDEAATGRIVNFVPYPPNCWDYGEWITQPWLCDDVPQDRVDMAFQLYALFCPWDMDGNGYVDPFDSNFVMARFGCPVGTGDPDCDKADIDGNGVVDPFDSNAVMAHFGQCP